METVCFSEILVSTYESTRRQNREKHRRRSKDLKSHLVKAACRSMQLFSQEIKGVFEGASHFLNAGLYRSC
jgi:hypothetical protein